MLAEIFSRTRNRRTGSTQAAGPVRSRADRSDIELAVLPAGCLNFAAATRNSRCGAVQRGRLARLRPPVLPSASLPTARQLRSAVAIENTAAPRSNDIVMVASAVLLGRDGLKAHAADTARIVRSGRLPLDEIMLLDQTGDDIAMICTTVALAAATVH